MDGIPSVSPHDLYARLGTASAPLLLDVRRQESFGADDRLIIGALHRAPEDVGRWQKELIRGRAVVAYCAYGQELSQGVAAALGRAGVQATYLERGISHWTEQGLPTRRKDGGGTDK